MARFEVFWRANIHPYRLPLVNQLDRCRRTQAHARAAFAQRRIGEHQRADNGYGENEDIIFIEQELQKIHGVS
jgi:hypothetical protein